MCNLILIFHKSFLNADFNLFTGELFGIEVYIIRNKSVVHVSREFMFRLSVFLSLNVNVFMRCHCQ